MSAIKLEFGTPAVIKVPRFPGSRVVACFAPGTKSALVYLVIVLLVTGVAIGWRIAEQLCLVAFLAFHLEMQSKQRETCTPMIELGVFPVFFAVAGLAAFAQAPLVNIVLNVARDTFLRQLLLIQLAGMAGDTLDLLVLAL